MGRAIKLVPCATALHACVSVGLLLLIACAGEAAGADCTVPVSFAGDGACTNSQTLNYTVGGATPAIQATGNLDVTNTSTGQIGASGSGAVISAGGGLTLNNAGKILTLTGGSNSAVTSGNGQAGVTTITNSGFIGDEATTSGGSIGIDAGNKLTSFTLTNTASGVIKSTSTTAIGVRTYAATSTINNAGTISGFTGVGLYAGVSTLTNSGTISALSTGLSRAITIQPGATATINNTSSGTINGLSNVIVINGTATLTNDGTVSGTDEPTVVRGIANYKPTISVMSGGSLTLTNRGAITGKGAAIQVASGAATTSITNSGTISATSTSAPSPANVSGIFLDNTTGGTTVTNTGTISGVTYGVNLNSGTMTLTNSGTISGGTSAVFLKTGGNTLNINNGAVFTNGIDYNNTTGNTTNFLNTSSYSLAVKNYSEAGNTVTLGNGLSRTDGRNIVNGNIVVAYTAPAAALPLASNAGTIEVVNMASVTNATAVQSSSYVTNISGMIGDVMSIGDLGYASQGASSDGGRSGSNLLGYVEIVKPKSKPVAAIDAALSKPQTMPAQGQVVDAAGNVLWSRAFAGAQYTPTLNGFGALNSYYFGAAVGLDHKFEDWQLGAYVGGGRASQSVLDGSGDMDGSVVFGGLYGHTDQSNVIADLGLSLGKLSNTSKRYINNGAQTATGSFGGLFVAPEAALGYRFELTDGWDVVPSVKLRYTGSFYEGYTETGSTQNVSYSDQSVHVFDERAQVKLTHTEVYDTGLKRIFYVQGSVQGAQRVGDSNLNATLAGNSYAVSASGDKSLLAGSVGAGFDVNLTTAAAIYGSADATFYTNGSRAIAGRVGLKLSF